MPASIVQQNAAAQDTGLATVSATLSSPATASNLLLVVVGSDDYAAVPPTGFTESPGCKLQTNLGHYLWWKVAAGGETSVSYTIGSASTSCWQIYEISGLTSTPYDISAGQFVASGASTYTTQAITPTAGDRLLVASMGGSMSAGNFTSLTVWLNSFSVQAVTTNNKVSGTRDIIGMATRSVTADGVTSYSSGATYTPNATARTGIIISFKVAGAATASFPPYWEGRRRLLAAPRLPRARVSNPIPAQIVVPPPPLIPSAVRTRLRFARVWRGRSAQPVPAQIVVTSPAYPPQSVRTRLRFARVWRGRQVAPVPAQVVVVPPAYPPQGLRTRLRGVRLARGRAVAPVPAQTVVAPPAYVPGPQRSARKLFGLRRGKSATPPPQLAAPAPARRARPVTAPARRPHTVTPPPAAVPQVPPAWPVNFVRNARHWLRPRRGRAAVPGLGQSAPSIVRDLVLELLGPDPKWVATANPPRWLVEPRSQTWAATTAPPRWEVKVPATPETISSGSLQYVRRAIRNKVNGVSVDVTADVVKMAFMQGSAAPQASDLKAASWETDSTTVPTKYLARCLVGPGGAVTLLPGMYEVWVQVTDSPEVPLLPAGPLRVL